MTVVPASDLARIDAHVITPEEYYEIPELTDEDFDRGAWSINGVPITTPPQRPK